MKRKQEITSVRWDLALRYRLIETVAWWEGRLTTGHLMQSFGISRQQASKDINSYISEYAPQNLEYDKHLKGYVPSGHFKPLFIDDSASAYRSFSPIDPGPRKKRVNLASTSARLLHCVRSASFSTKPSLTPYCQTTSRQIWRTSRS